MNAYATALSSLALLMSSGAALASNPAFTTVDAQSVREWVASRGADAEKEETVEVDLVFNFMKGVGCTDEEAAAAAAAAAARANELLKDACVKVNVKEIHNDWTGPGNEDDPKTKDVDEADGEVSGVDIIRAKNAGLGEVTGDDGEGGTKKGYKVFIVKDFIDDLDDTVGCTIKCQPWTAIQKEVNNITIGEILAHEMGHSFGKLDDTYDMEDMNCLMYGRVKPGSERELKEGEGDKIRGGARNHGRVVRRDPDAPDEAPKLPAPRANGGINKLEVQPIVNPAGQLLWAGVTAPFFEAPDASEIEFEFTVRRDLGIPDPTFIHLGIDADGDPLTGVPFGPWTGIEFQLTFFFDPLLIIEPQMTWLNLVDGSTGTAPLDAGLPPLLPDGFPELPLPPLPEIPIQELQLHGVLPISELPFLVGPQPAFVQGWVTPQPDPQMIPQPLDDPFQFPMFPDDFFGRPILVAPGFALPGDVIPVDGFGFPPLSPVQICIDNFPAGVAMTDPFGQFIGFPLPLDPLFFGVDGSGYSFISGKANPVGPAGTTWIEGPGAGTPCPSDLNGDGVVDAADLADMLAMWGPNPGAPGDLDSDGLVNAADLAIMLAAWGPCP